MIILSHMNERSELCELTDEELRAASEELAERRREADREDVFLVGVADYLLNASVPELVDTLPEEDLAEVLSYRQDTSQPAN